MAARPTIQSFFSRAPACAPAPQSILLSSVLSDLVSMEDPFESSSQASLESLSSSSSSRKRPSLARPRTSWVWNHMPDEDPETRYYIGEQLDKNLVWKCKYCPPNNQKTYRVSGGNNKIKEHLTNEGVPDRSPRLERAKKQQLSIVQAQQQAAENPHKRRKLDRKAGDSIDPDTLEVLYVNFVAACNQSLRLNECEEFRDLLFYLNNDITTWLPTSHTSVTDWAIRQFNAQEEKQHQRLHSARSDIHLMGDLWSAPNHRSIIGVVARFVGEDGRIENTVLAVKTVTGGHDGENLSTYVVDVIRRWGIASKLGYLTLDNASNNETMCKKMSLGMLFRASPTIYYYWY